MPPFRKLGETEEMYQQRLIEHRVAHSFDGYGAEIVALIDAAARALPLLERLGDYMGNGKIDVNRPGSLGERCDVLADLKQALRVVGPRPPDADDVPHLHRLTGKPVAK